MDKAKGHTEEEEEEEAFKNGDSDSQWKSLNNPLETLEKTQPALNNPSQPLKKTRPALH